MVNSQTTAITYTSNGVTTAYSVGYYFMAFTDLVVQVNTAGTITTAVNGVDYVMTGPANAYGAYPNGGTLTWQPGSQYGGPPAANATFTITRNTKRTQPDTYVDNSAFPATVNESDLDRLTLITQEIAAVGSGFIGVLAGPPTSGAFTAGQWFILTPFTAGNVFGYCCTASGSPGTWKSFGPISL